MATEIERKFLVTGDGWRAQADAGVRIRQGYLASGERASVRIRRAGTQAWINIKGATLGVERQEYDYEIPLGEAEEMLEQLCRTPLIDKTRYHVPVGGHVWDVDVFEGENAGLVVAEIELDAADEPFERPDWAGEEVSDRPRYYNVALVDHPYRDWSAAERRGDP
ncbi:CYTH domain-containing protein [Arhodomonas sp. SL1]|uniref:CYTH domain-containing protein n=1 Tax=Arhodomonas sp. SL1 TaxID=3425691 RepID=UPI003F884A90